MAPTTDAMSPTYGERRSRSGRRVQQTRRYEPPVSSDHVASEREEDDSYHGEHIEEASTITTKKNPKKRSRKKKTSKSASNKRKKMVEVIKKRKYDDIRMWDKQTWDKVMGLVQPANAGGDAVSEKKHSNRKTQSDGGSNAPVNAVPQHIVNRFGSLCFVRLNIRDLVDFPLEVSNSYGDDNAAKPLNDFDTYKYCEDDSWWFPAVEINPVYVRGSKKYDLRRDWLLLAEQIKSLQRKDKSSTNENSPNSKDIHMILFLGVDLGIDCEVSGISVRRTREPFALITNEEDWMSFRQGSHLGYHHLPLNLRYKLKRLQNHKNPKDFPHLWEEELMEGLVSLQRLMGSKNRHEEICTMIFKEYVSSDEADDEFSAFGSTSSMDELCNFSELDEDDSDNDSESNGNNHENVSYTNKIEREQKTAQASERIKTEDNIVNTSPAQENIVNTSPVVQVEQVVSNKIEVKTLSPTFSPQEAGKQDVLKHRVNEMETMVFGRHTVDSAMKKQVCNLEKSVFGSDQSGTLKSRILALEDRLKKFRDLLVSLTEECSDLKIGDFLTLIDCLSHIEKIVGIDDIDHNTPFYRRIKSVKDQVL